MDNFEAARQCFAEGLKQLAANHLPAAEASFARSLDFLPDRISTLNNLSAVKIRLEKFTEAEALARKAIAIETGSPEAWSNLGIVLAATNRHEEALQAHDRAIQSNPQYAKGWLNKATALVELERYEEARAACDQALKLDPGQPDILHVKSRVSNGLGYIDEAKQFYLKSLDRKFASAPAYVSERRVSQKAEVLIVSHDPAFDGSLKSFETLHQDCSNYPAQLAWHFRDDFHFSFVFEGNVPRPSARNSVPPPDVVINNCANGELVLLKNNAKELAAFMDSFGAPVINHPSKVVQTNRDGTVKLLRDAPGVLVPKTQRFFSTGKSAQTLAREIEDHFEYPVITRTLSAQEGRGMTKVNCRDALIAGFAAGLPENFFVTQFIDNRNGNPFFRKIRAAIVKDEIILTRVDYSDDWNVRGRKQRKRVALYLENPHLLDEEKRICGDPEAALGRPAVESLQAIRTRMPLDVFGMDFDVNAEGLVVFYEANATMNLLSTAQKEVPNPKEANDRLKHTFQSYLAHLSGRR